MTNDSSSRSAEPAKTVQCVHIPYHHTAEFVERKRKIIEAIESEGYIIEPYCDLLCGEYYDRLWICKARHLKPKKMFRLDLDGTINHYDVYMWYKNDQQFDEAYKLANILCIKLDLSFCLDEASI